MIQSRLPKEVELVPGSMYYRHDSKLAVIQLAARLRDIPEASIPSIAALALDKGVMRPQWWARLAYWVAKKRGMSGFDFWFTLCTQHPSMGSDLIQKAADWMVSGKDREQPGSVGGFSQRELNFFANCVAIATGAMSAELERTAERNAVN